MVGISPRDISGVVIRLCSVTAFDISPFEDTGLSQQQAEAGGGGDAGGDGGRHSSTRMRHAACRQLIPARKAANAPHNAG
ncbi:hypothetical protein LTR66_015110, partial [Elasticomyces elasticus]